MRIQTISNYNIVAFGMDKRRKNTDRTATVQDLYDMEDRIKKQNANLFAKQNKLLGATLDNIARVAYLTTESGTDSDVHYEFDKAIRNSDILIHNGKIKNNTKTSWA